MRYTNSWAVLVCLLVMTPAAYAQTPTPAALGNEAMLRDAVHQALATPALATPALDVLIAGAPVDALDAQGNAAPPPKPAHTGLAALAFETLSDFKAFPRRRSTWVILGVGGALALAVHPADHTLNAHLVSSSWADNLWKPGNFVGGTGMAIAPIGIYLIGRYAVAEDPSTRTNKWSHLGFDLVRAQIVDEAFVQGIKFSVRRTRPNGSKYSFPSGHAAATFALASVLERHLGYRFAWPTLAIATYVGTSRLHDNVHYLSDVVFGAALGTAVGWTVVGRHGRSNYSLGPALVPGGIALAFTRTR